MEVAFCHQLYATFFPSWPSSLTYAASLGIRRDYHSSPQPAGSRRRINHGREALAVSVLQAAAAALALMPVGKVQHPEEG